MPLSFATCKYLYSKAMSAMGMIRIFLDPEDTKFLDMKNISYQKKIENNNVYYIVDSADLRALFCHH